MLAFAHLAERPPDADPSTPDPGRQVRLQAQRILGEQLGAFQDLTQDSILQMPHFGEISFVPQVEGIEFNPPRRSFQWCEPVHREEFRLRAQQEMLGSVAHGRLSVLFGAILIAEVPLSIRVGSEEPGVSPEARFSSSSVPPYRKIFASYSHRDLAVVEEFEGHARAVGDQYLRDLIDLRAGEVGMTASGR